MLSCRPVDCFSLVRSPLLHTPTTALQQIKSSAVLSSRRKSRTSSPGVLTGAPVPKAGRSSQQLWSRAVSLRSLSSPMAARALNTDFLELLPYEAPPWTQTLALVPKDRCKLGMFPTPIHRWHLPGLPAGVEVWIKRDDMTGMQLSGNKVRKLEFLMADAQRQGCDTIITIGGIQSNHARATAVAARYLGFECHLILRTSRVEVDRDPGLTGNLLVDRLTGALLHKVTKEEYVEKGSVALCEQLAAQLTAQGRRPYIIPVGGSDSLGTWGYLQAVEEMQGQQQQLHAQQQREQEAGTVGGGRQQRAQQEEGKAVGDGLAATPFFTDIAMACGSGGTTAGVALGNHLSSWGARVHAYGVCDTPTYFYEFIDGLIAGLKTLAQDTTTDDSLQAASLLRAIQAKGDGYALSTEEELQTVMDVAQATGVILDPVYSGKAVHAMLAEMTQHPHEWLGRRVLFIHTGGLLGMYDKSRQLQVILDRAPERVQRMQIA